ncbi:MAG: YjdF family protein [Acutalibacteraceae bacterium]
MMIDEADDFEAPFWVGVFERFEGGTLSVCKITFGAEPKDYDVLVCAEKLRAARFSPAVAAASRNISVHRIEITSMTPYAASTNHTINSRHCEPDCGEHIFIRKNMESARITRPAIHSQLERYVGSRCSRQNTPAIIANAVVELRFPVPVIVASISISPVSS